MGAAKSRHRRSFSAVASASLFISSTTNSAHVVSAFLPSPTDPISIQHANGRRFGPSPHAHLTAEPTNENIEEGEVEGSQPEDPWDYDGEEYTANYEGNIRINELAEMSAKGDGTAASRAEEVLNGLESRGLADTVSYNGVIKAYGKAKSKYAVRKAEQILDRMERAYEAMQRRDLEDDTYLAQLIKPNVRTYATLLNAYSSNPFERTAEESEAVLDRVQKMYENTGDPDLAINPFVINSVLNHYAKSNRGEEGAIRAQEILNEMEQVGPVVDVVSYNCVADAWARSGVDDAGERAEAILRRMEDRTKKDESLSWAAASDYDAVSPPRPNVRTYCCVLDAWSRSNHPSSATKASDILTELQQKYDESEDSSLRPNPYAFGAVLNAYAQSNQPDKATAALKILRLMHKLWSSGKNLSARPNIIHYNTCLNACATTRHGRDEAMVIVRTLYKEITSEKSHVRPDAFTYGTVLKACANLAPTRGEDVDFITSVFQRCCTEGQASFQVCLLLKQAAPMELMRELLPRDAFEPITQKIAIEKMPKSWRKNVKERRNRKFKRS